jgi:hypothetical protein
MFEVRAGYPCSVSHQRGRDALWDTWSLWTADLKLLGGKARTVGFILMRGRRTLRDTPKGFFYAKIRGWTAAKGLPLTLSR